MAIGPGAVIFYAPAPGNKPLPAEMDGAALVPRLRIRARDSLCAARAVGPGVGQPSDGLFCGTGAVIPDL